MKKIVVGASLGLAFLSFGPMSRRYPGRRPWIIHDRYGDEWVEREDPEIQWPTYEYGRYRPFLAFADKDHDYPMIPTEPTDRVDRRYLTRGDFLALLERRKR